jgi:hypothetical protein
MHDFYDFGAEGKSVKQKKTKKNSCRKKSSSANDILS